MEIITEKFVATCNVTLDATGAFFDIDSSDDMDLRTKKIAKTTIGRVVYNFLDYGMAVICAGLVGALNYYSLEFWKIALTIWIFDFISAIIFLSISEKSGHDITLGESFRRAIDTVRINSQIGGALLGLLLGIQALIWEGTVRLVVFFKKEISTIKRMVMALFVLTFFQGFFWAWIYSLGYESVGALIKNFL